MFNAERVEVGPGEVELKKRVEKEKGARGGMCLHKDLLGEEGRVRRERGL